MHERASKADEMLGFYYRANYVLSVFDESRKKTSQERKSHHMICTWAKISVCHGAGGKAVEAPWVAPPPCLRMECPFASTVATSMKPLNSAIWQVGAHIKLRFQVLGVEMSFLFKTKACSDDGLPHTIKPKTTYQIHYFLVSGVGVVNTSCPSWKEHTLVEKWLFSSLTWQGDQVS